MSSKLVLIAAAGAAALAGCSTVNKPVGVEDAAFGEAVKYNAAVQTINPAPVYAEGGAQAGDNGDKGAQAVKRYRTDQVKKLETFQTTTAVSGSSGSSPR